MDAVKKEIERLFYQENGEIEEFLKEAGKSLLRYIETGVENKQLEDMGKAHSYFAREYKKYFDMDSIIKSVVENAKKSASASCSQKENFINDFCDMFLVSIKENFTTIIKDVAYLSHANMLYELYEQEQKVKQKEKEYESIKKNDEKVLGVVQLLDEKKRMTLNDLQKQLGVNKTDLMSVLNKNLALFNIREKSDKTINVSLSPKGKEFNKHVFFFNNSVSRSTLNKLLYKNCNMLVESFEATYEKKMIYKIKLEGLDHQSCRSIEYKYYRTASKIVDEQENRYYTLPEEEVSRNGEKVIYTIPREGNDQIGRFV